MQHLSNSFVHIAECLEPMNMLIDRSFSDIATTRIGDLECTKPLQESWEEEYPDSDFFHEIGIEVLHTHGSGIECERIVYECDHYIQRSDNIEKCHHITNTRNIVEGELLEKKSTSNEWKGSIF